MSDNVECDGWEPIGQSNQRGAFLLKAFCSGDWSLTFSGHHRTDGEPLSWIGTAENLEAATRAVVAKYRMLVGLS